MDKNDIRIEAVKTLSHVIDLLDFDLEAYRASLNQVGANVQNEEVNILRAAVVGDFDYDVKKTVNLLIEFIETTKES